MVQEREVRGSPVENPPSREFVREDFAPHAEPGRAHPVVIPSRQIEKVRRGTAARHALQISQRDQFHEHRRTRDPNRHRRATDTTAQALPAGEHADYLVVRQ